MSDGLLTTALDRFISLLAACPAFRTLTGAATIAEARGRIHKSALPAATQGFGYPYTEDELIALRPYARVWNSPIEGYRLRAIALCSGPFQWEDSGSVVCELEWTVPVDIAEDDASVQAYGDRVIGLILEDMIGLIGTSSSFLSPKEIVVVGGPERVPPEERIGYGDAQGALLRLEW